MLSVLVIPPSLRTFVETIASLEAETWAEIEPLFARRELQKGEHFEVAGTVARRIGLLETGWVRAYLITEDGREFNKHLFKGPSIIGDYASLITGEPVRLGQQALTDCVVWVAPYRAIDQMSFERPDLQRLARRHAEIAYLQKEEREIELVTLEARERYRRLVERFPTIETDLPQYHIAQYLGITATQLSRIRARSRPR